MIASLQFTNKSNNRPWRAVLVKSDDRYSRLCPYTVKFYDLSYPEKFGEEGQFASDYLTNTLLHNERDHNWPHGICLHGAIPEWNIGAKEFAAVLDFIKESLPNEESSHATT